MALRSQAGAPSLAHKASRAPPASFPACAFVSLLSAVQADDTKLSQYPHHRQVELADSNRNKCRVSKVKIAKGEMKFCWRTGADSWASCSMDALPSTVVPRTIGVSAVHHEACVHEHTC